MFMVLKLMVIHLDEILIIQNRRFLKKFQKNRPNTSVHVRDPFFSLKNNLLSGFLLYFIIYKYI
jgi:hypothetical protein